MNNKEQIAKIAFMLFTQNGYKATSISQLVTHSKLSKGAFYHYFKSKQEVYEYVIDYYFLSFYRKFDWEIFSNSSLEDFNHQITEMYKGFISQIKELTKNNPSKYFILFFEAYNFAPNFKKVIQQFYTQFKEILSKKITTEKNISQQLGEMQAMDIVSKFEGLFFWLAVFPDENISKYLKIN